MGVDNIETVRVINVDEKNSLLFCFPDHFSLCGYSFSRINNDIFTVYGERLPSKIRKDKSFVLGKKSQPYTLLDDILIIASLLSGRNWFREALNGSESSLRLLSNTNCFQSRPPLPAFPGDDAYFFDLIEKCILKMSDESWLNKYENGFHLKMLFNNSAYIFKPESRFLSMMVIWEWMYPHEYKVQPINDLVTVLKKDLEFAFGKHTVPDKNIFYILRNQLAHSGKIPINHKDAEDWMKSLLFEDASITKYINFFNELTRILAFKAFDIHLEEQPRMNISDDLKEFLSTGKIK